MLTDFARHHSYKKDNVMYEDTLYGTKYNYYGHYNYFNFLEEQISIPFIMTEETRCTKQPLLSNHSKYILDSHDHWHTTNEDTWQDCYDTTSLGNDPISNSYRDVINKTHGIYLFPLIGEDDTTSTTDTTGTTDTAASSIISPQVENFTYVFPNPAKENITIQSSFKMHNIEIYNEQGQKVKEYKPASYNTTIDISNLAK